MSLANGAPERFETAGLPDCRFDKVSGHSYRLVHIPCGKQIGTLGMNPAPGEAQSLLAGHDCPLDRALPVNFPATISF